MAVIEGSRPSQLVLVGEIDTAVADQLRAAGYQAASTLAPGGRVEIDMADVTFIDSSGLGALVAILNVARIAGGKVALCNVPARVARILELSGLRDTFEFLPPLEPVATRGPTGR